MIVFSHVSLFSMSANPSFTERFYVNYIPGVSQCLLFSVYDAKGEQVDENDRCASLVCDLHEIANSNQQQITYLLGHDQADKQSKLKNASITLHVRH